MLAALRTSIIFLGLMTFLLGLVYPALIWLGGQAFFPSQAQGSLVTDKNIIIGSSLIGQNFTQDRYFWGRPSGTQPFPYNAQNSGSSHMNVAHPELKEKIEKRMSQLQHDRQVPIDLVSESASGLDPHISPQAAYIQVPRIAQARHMDEGNLRTLIKQTIQEPSFGFLGERRVNVLQLNLLLDTISP